MNETNVNTILTYLDDDDKNVFKEKVIKENDFESFKKMNIWYKNNTEPQLFENYKYTEINETIYAFPLENGSILMFTKNKKLIFQANQTNFNLVHCLQSLSNMLYFRDKININNITKNDKSIIFTQNFNYLYGHFCDEIFTAYDFKNKFTPNSDNYCLVNFNKNIKCGNEIGSLLFDTKFLNIRDFSDGIEIPKIVIIEHHYNLETFHSFPLPSKLQILSNIQINNECKCKNIFLTRKQQFHINRELDNLQKIENELQQNDFHVFNPENITYSETINNIKHAKKIVITWGSALINLIYSKPGAKIVILKSNSYKNEGIGIFRNLIKNYNLNIKIIESNNNNIIESREIIDCFTF